MKRKFFTAAAIAVAVILVAANAMSCSFASAESDASGQVSFMLDAGTVQSIQSKIFSISRSSASGEFEFDSSLSMEISLHGGWQDATSIPVSDGATATFNKVPIGLSVYAKAVVYSQDADSRHDFLFGRSEEFIVKAGVNSVSLVLGTEDPDEYVEPSNQLPVNIIFVANAVSGGADANDGTEASPLDSIEHAVAKIHELVEDPNNSYNSGEAWGIVLLSDLEGGQIIPDTADSDVLGFTIASKEAADIKTINGGFDNSNPGTTLTINSAKAVVLQCIKITGGYNVSNYYGGGGVYYRGEQLVINAGAEIYGNTSIYKGGGIYAASTSTNEMSLMINGGSIYENTCINGMGGGVCVEGRQEGVGTENATLAIAGGSIKKNKADKGGGLCVTGTTSAVMTGGSISQNSNYTADSGMGGGIYLDAGTYTLSFLMTGGAVSFNSSKHAAGAYAYKAIFGIGQTASFAPADYVCVYSTTIIVTDDLAKASAPTIEPTTYTPGTQIASKGPSLSTTDFINACSKFSVKPQDDGTLWYVGYDGALTTTNPSVEGNVSIYVSATGSDTTGDGSSANPFATLGRAVDYIRDNPYSKANYIVNIAGTIIGETAITGDIVAKSIKLVGTTGVNGSGEPQDVLDGNRDEHGVLTVAVQGLKVYIKDLKITRNDRGLMVGMSEYDQNGNLLALITSEVVLESGVYITYNQGRGWDGAGILINKNSSVTMNSGCEISNNATGMGSCGGVYIDEGTFLMQGGTISGNEGKNGKSAVYVGGRFEMSGDASIPYDSSEYRNYVTVPVVGSQTTPGTYSVKYPIIIAGNLSATTAATIKPEEEEHAPSDPPLAYQNGWQCVTETSSGLLSANYSKFEVLPESTPSSPNWTINASGQLDDGTGNGGGGGGTSGSVTLYVRQDGMGDGSSADTAGALASIADAATYISTNGNSSTDFIIKVVGTLNSYQTFELSDSSCAKSVTIEGKAGESGLLGTDTINGGNVTGQAALDINIQSGSLTPVLKNIKITGGGGSGLAVGGFDGLDGNSYTKVVLEEGVYITQNTTDSSGDGGGINVREKATVTMKDTCSVVSNAATRYGGGVSIARYGTFIMEGGTISGNTCSTGNGVYVAGAFYMSGNAFVNSNNDVCLRDTQIIINGGITNTGTVATITPWSYPSGGSIVLVLSEEGTGSVSTEHSKFAVTPNGTTNYTVDESGYLQEQP